MQDFDLPSKDELKGRNRMKREKGVVIKAYFHIQLLRSRIRVDLLHILLRPLQFSASNKDPRYR